MLRLKAVSTRDLRIGLLIMAVFLALISIASLVLGTLGTAPSGFGVSDGGGSRLWILEQFGYPGRWGGPFGSVNYAAPIGGLLVVVGLTSKRWMRILLILVGSLILLLSQGRSAVVALMAAALTLVLWGPRFQRFRHRNLLRVFILLTVVTAIVGYIFGVAPSLNGRTSIWGDFTSLFSANPIFGVGTTGVIDFVVENESQPGFVPHTHAHSVILDGATRYGLVFIVLTLAIYALATTSAIRALPDLGPGPLALAVFVIFSGLAETTHSWFYWSTYLAVLTYVALVSSSATQEDRSKQEYPNRTGSSLP